MNKLYFMLFAAGLSLLLAGCTQIVPEPTTKYVCSDGKTTVTDITTCPAPVTATPSLTKEEELSACSGMPSVQTFVFEDLCIVGIAGKYQDTSLCRKVGRDQRILCYLTIAELKGDAGICGEAESTTINQCYEQYARDKREGSACGKITDIGYRDSCYSNLANQLADAGLCEKIMNVGQKDGCYFSTAMRFGDSSYCDKITSSDQKQNCLQNLQGSKGQQSMPPVQK